MNEWMILLDWIRSSGSQGSCLQWCCFPSPCENGIKWDPQRNVPVIGSDLLASTPRRHIRASFPHFSTVYNLPHSPIWSQPFFPIFISTISPQLWVSAMGPLPWLPEAPWFSPLSNSYHGEPHERKDAQVQWHRGKRHWNSDIWRWPWKVTS